ncbi:MAG: CPBP family glutamic-type intramembrane protease, partial [Candidatus Cloacimonetes bacterium]|nr:CPBP family glutamic-type intramembrane protease [Candidatus Cloacimonadota bacterium]
LYKDKAIDAILTLKLGPDSLGTMMYFAELQFDGSSEKGRLLRDKIQEKIKAGERILLENRIISLGADTSLLKVLELKPLDTSSSEKKLGSILGMILPYLLIMLLITGAAVVASDLVAGEKERKTLETLLVSSAARNEFVLGKYLTIITFAMVNVFINLFSLFFSMRYMISQSGLEFSGLAMPLEGFGILLLVFIPLATLFAAILLSISTFSKNMKESRSYEQPLMLIAMFASMITFFPGIEISNLFAIIPVVNIALLFKAVMINEYQLSHLLLTIGSTILLDVIAIWITIRLFNTEKVLFRSDDEGSLKNVKKEKRNLFNPFYGMIYFVIALVLLYYLGGWLQAKDLAKGLMQTQVFVIGLPVFLIIRVFKLREKEILRTKAPRPLEILLVPFISVSAAVLVASLSQLIDFIYPFPDEYLKIMNKLFQIEGGLWRILLIVAVFPGIFEEIMFRGFMIRFFEGNGKKMAVIIGAILFAAFHLDPFRFFPVFLLGLLLGYLTLRSGSLYNSMLCHAVNNGTAILISTYASLPWMKQYIISGESLQWWVIGAALVVFVITIFAFQKVTANKEMGDI